VTKIQIESLESSPTFPFQMQLQTSLGFSKSNSFVVERRTKANFTTTDSCCTFSSPLVCREGKVFDNELYRIMKFIWENLFKNFSMEEQKETREGRKFNSLSFQCFSGE
jgi:hypothetical protein